MDKTTVRLVDEFKNEVSKVEVPTSSGNAKELFEDYMGIPMLFAEMQFTEWLCETKK